MQKNTTKSMTNRKKYGKPYENKQWLMRGDMKLIAETTGFAYVSIVQQMNGERAMHPMVETMADRIVETNRNQVNELDTNLK